MNTFQLSDEPAPNEIKPPRRDLNDCIREMALDLIAYCWSNLTAAEREECNRAKHGEPFDAHIINAAHAVLYSEIQQKKKQENHD